MKHLGTVLLLLCLASLLNSCPSGREEPDLHAFLDEAIILAEGGAFDEASAMLGRIEAEGGWQDGRDLIDEMIREVAEDPGGDHLGEAFIFASSVTDRGESLFLGDWLLASPDGGLGMFEATIKHLENLPSDLATEYERAFCDGFWNLALVPTHGDELGSFLARLSISQDTRAALRRSATEKLIEAQDLPLPLWDRNRAGELAGEAVRWNAEHAAPLWAELRDLDRYERLGRKVAYAISARHQHPAQLAFYEKWLADTVGPQEDWDEWWRVSEHVDPEHWLRKVIWPQGSPAPSFEEVLAEFLPSRGDRRLQLHLLLQLLAPKGPVPFWSRQYAPHWEPDEFSSSWFALTRTAPEELRVRIGILVLRNGKLQLVDDRAQSLMAGEELLVEGLVAGAIPIAAPVLGMQLGSTPFTLNGGARNGDLRYLVRASLNWQRRTFGLVVDTANTDVSWPGNSAAGPGPFLQSNMSPIIVPKGSVQVIGAELKLCREPDDDHRITTFVIATVESPEENGTKWSLKDWRHALSRRFILTANPSTPANVGQWELPPGNGEWQLASVLPVEPDALAALRQFEGAVDPEDWAVSSHGYFIPLARLLAGDERALDSESQALFRSAPHDLFTHLLASTTQSPRIRDFALGHLERHQPPARDVRALHSQAKNQGWEAPAWLRERGTNSPLIDGWAWALAATLLAGLIGAHAIRLVRARNDPQRRGKLATRLLITSMASAGLAVSYGGVSIPLFDLCVASCALAAWVMLRSIRRPHWVHYLIPIAWFSAAALGVTGYLWPVCDRISGLFLGVGIVAIPSTLAALNSTETPALRRVRTWIYVPTELCGLLLVVLHQTNLMGLLLRELPNPSSHPSSAGPSTLLEPAAAWVAPVFLTASAVGLAAGWYLVRRLANAFENAGRLTVAETQS